MHRNGSAANLRRYDCEPLIGKGIAALVDGDDSDNFLRAVCW